MAQEPNMNKVSSQAGLASIRPPRQEFSVPAPGEPGSPFNPVVRERGSSQAAPVPPTSMRAPAPSINEHTTEAQAQMRVEAQGRVSAAPDPRTAPANAPKPVLPPQGEAQARPTVGAPMTRAPREVPQRPANAPIFDPPQVGEAAMEGTQTEAETVSEAATSGFIQGAMGQMQGQMQASSQSKVQERMKRFPELADAKVLSDREKLLGEPEQTPAPEIKQGGMER